MTPDNQAPRPNGWHKVRQAFSRENREIVFLLSDAQAQSPVDTLIIGVFHGDEREAETLASAFVSQVNPARDFPGRRVGIVPVLNPDGLAQGTRVNADKVDLNRNYPTRDWHSQDEGTPYFSGPAAGSEPETRFILSLLEAYAPRKIITLHTPYRVINYDGPAEALAEAMAACNGYPVVADIGYGTPGSFGTYVGKERNIPTITLELPENEAFTQADLENNLQALRQAVLF